MNSGNPAEKEAFSYNEAYYSHNRQSRDRIALNFYFRLARSFQSEGTMLDFGCGMGHFIKRFCDAYEAWAFDVSPYALESTRKVAPFAKICSDAGSLPEDTFDLVTALHVLEHVEKPHDFLRLFNSILKEKGYLMYVVPNAAGAGHHYKKKDWCGYKDPSHVSLLPAEKWLDLTEASGFRVVKTGTDGLWDVPYLPFIPTWIQKLLFYPFPALQVITGRLIWPLYFGESLIVVAQKKT